VSIFTKNYPSPADKFFRTGESPYSGTLGPNRTSDPIRDPWTAEVKKNPDYGTFYNRTFDQVAPQSQAKIDAAAQTDEPNFANPGDQSFAKDFAKRYAEAISRGLVEEDRAVTRGGLARISTEYANYGSNEKDPNTAGKFPNQGVSV
jgi:hypothetical protein